MKLLNKRILPVISLVLLTSCNNHTSSISSITSSYNPSSIETSNITKEELFNKLKEVASNHNYTLDYIYKNQTYSNIVNEQYYINSSQNIGYVLLDSVYENYPQVFYKMEINPTINVQEILTYTDSDDNLLPVTEISQLDDLSILNDPSFNISEKDFKYVKKGVFKVSNKNLLKAFANLLGYEDSLFNSFDISYSNDSFTFVLNQYKNIENQIAEEERKGVITNINISKDEEVESLFENSYLPNNKITSSLLSKLTKSSLSFENSIYYVSDQEKLIGSEVFSYNSSSYSSKLTSNNKTTLQSYKEVRGKVAQVMLNAYNELETIIIPSVSYTSLPFIYKYVDTSEFLTSDFKTYKYYGMNIKNIASSITNVSLPSEYRFVEFSLNLENNEITSANLKTNTVINDNKPTYYSFDIDIKTSNIVISTPSILKENENTSKVKEIFTNFKNSTSFKISSSTSYNKARINYEFDKDIFITSKYDHEDNLNLTGTYLKDQKLQNFISNNNTFQLQGRPYQGNIQDSFMLNFAYEIFDIQDNSIVLRDDIYNLSSSMLLGYYGNMLISNSFKLEIENNLPKKISYNYDLFGGYTGLETLEFTYNHSIDASTRNKIESLPSWSKPTSWQEENENVYNELVNFYSKEIADTIPYIYSENTTGSFGTFITTNLNIFSFKAKLEDYNLFYQAFIDAGYEEYVNQDDTFTQDDPNFRKVYLRKGEVSLKLQYSLDNEEADNPEYELDLYFYR